MDIGFLEYHNTILKDEWESTTRLMKAMVDLPNGGLFAYDMLHTLRRMEELYIRIATTTETIGYAKGEIR